MSNFNKEEYTKNRKNKIRGQGKLSKPKVKVNETSTILFIDGNPTRTNRAQRRRIIKHATKD